MYVFIYLFISNSNSKKLYFIRIIYYYYKIYIGPIHKIFTAIITL